MNEPRIVEQLAASAAPRFMFALFPSLRLVASEHLWIGDSDV